MDNTWFLPDFFRISQPSSSARNVNVFTGFFTVDGLVGGRKILAKTAYQIMYSKKILGSMSLSLLFRNFVGKIHDQLKMNFQQW